MARRAVADRKLVGLFTVQHPLEVARASQAKYAAGGGSFFA